MSYPRYLLEALKLPAVTNARASTDFMWSYDNGFKMPYTAWLVWALGMKPSKVSTAVGTRRSLLLFKPADRPCYSRPFKSYLSYLSLQDNFWTTGPSQGGGRFTHPNPFAHSVLAALSTGPVGFSDRLNMTNVSTTHYNGWRFCRELTPCVPAGVCASHVQCPRGLVATLHPCPAY